MSDTLPTTEVITELRDSGLTWAEISQRVGVPIVVAQQIHAVPQWPKLVTRVAPDGSARFVRYP